MYVYLLTNPARIVLYIGVTNDLTRRLAEHGSRLGIANRFTGRYQADLLVYFELQADPHASHCPRKRVERAGAAPRRKS